MTILRGDRSQRPAGKRRELHSFELLAGNGLERSVHLFVLDEIRNRYCAIGDVASQALGVRGFGGDTR